MALKLCKYCRMPTIVPGPRNQKIEGCCSKCRWKGLRDLAELDMLSREEAEELNALLQPQGEPLMKTGLVVSLIFLTACAGAPKAPEKERIVACTTQHQWTAVDQKTGIHVCFGAEGGLYYNARPLPAPPEKPQRKAQPKVEKGS